MNANIRSKPQRWRHAAGRMFFWIGVVATLLGLYEGIDHVREVWQKSAADRSDHSAVTDSKLLIHLSAEDSVPAAILAADLIEIRGGKHQVLPRSTWLVNRVVLLDGATLVGSDITIIANTIEGGRIDVSGSPSTEVKGASGGDILLAARRISNVELLARGGDGTPGTQGAPGAHGQDGRCDGFGGYRGANGGGNGAPGGNGGAGGDGGHIRVVGEISPAPQPSDYRGGASGAPGSGGPPGQGGRGCTGLGGSQPNQGDGVIGAPGSPGRVGEPGTYDARPLSYDQLRRIVRTANDPKAAREQILRAAFEPKLQE